jgi:hypothetical protein
MRTSLAVWGGVLAVIVVCTAQPARAVEYRLDATVAAYRWVEDLGSIEVKESGPVLQLGGYVSGYPYISGSPSGSAAVMTLRGDLRVLVGRVEFDTYNQDLSTGALAPVTTHTTYLGITPEGSIGLRQGVESGYLEPFIGLGYRWWWRDIGGDTGYPEYYNLIYGRLGLRTEHGLGGTLKFHTTFSVDPVLWARETIDLTESAYIDSGGALVQGQRFTVENGLRPGWTVEVGIRQGMVDLTGYWQAVRLDESNSVTCYDSVDPAARRSCFQPESHQDIFGLRVGLAF